MIASTTRKHVLAASPISLLTLRCSLHHTKLPQYMKDMKKYHLAHHYKNFELGFGVTSA
jgi:sterol desaturase/sphingolipid hydroxylase (fatty acid hydroxylase superfamily)